MTIPKAIDRKKWREELKKRQKESYDKREDTGKFKPIFIDGISRDKFWRPAVGEHQINIIPYKAGKNDPNADEGTPVYLLDIWVHGGVGVNDDNYVCLSRNYGEDCPICNHQEALRQEDDYDEDLVKSLTPKRRVVYNIECLSSPKEQAKGIQIFEIAHFSFEKPLTEQSKLPKGGGFVYFADPDEGKIISFEAKAGTFTKKVGDKSTVQKKTDYISFQFLDRDEVISDELLSKAYILDEIVKKPTYDEVYKAYFQESPETENDVKEEENDDVPFEFPKSNIPKKKEAQEAICPIGLNIGADYDQYEECDSCKNKDLCGSIYRDELNKEEKIIEEEAKPTPKRRRPGR